MTRGHVLVDARFLGTGTGLDRYTTGLVTALLERADDVRYTLVVRDEGAGSSPPIGPGCSWPTCPTTRSASRSASPGWSPARAPTSSSTPTSTPRSWGRDPSS